jgi:hypothetical protein
MTKRELIIALLMCILTVNFGFAQQRTEKEIKKLVKGAPTTNDFSYSTLGFGFKETQYDFVSLKSINDNELSDLEKDLINQYTNVAFGFHGGTIIHFYWVRDSEDRIGAIGFDGTTLVPPVKGKICQAYTNTAVVGEVEYASQTDWLNALEASVKEHTGVAKGHFCAVLNDITSNKINVVIPAGKYDDIMYSIKWSKPYWFVAKLVDDNLKWGVLNFKGEEEIPCEHKGIYKTNNKGQWLIGYTGGKYNTTETMDMDEANNMVINREALARERRERWGILLSSFGEAMISAGNTVQAVHANSGSNSTSSSNVSGSGSYETQYANWERIAKQHYNSLTNLGTQYKKDGKDVTGNSGQGASSSNYTQMKKSLREAQNEMKNIRTKAKKNGVEITKSEYEDIEVSY